MPDRAASVEELGIEHVPEELRHGSPGRVFTIWFGANLTIADYVIGVLAVQAFGLTFEQSVPVILVGNVLAGLTLGLSAGMGPKLGFPQMLSSRGSFGRKGNYLFGALNWASTVGWFTVNTILGVEAVQVLFPGASFLGTALILVVVQVLVAVYGHDFIHLFEKLMSAVLGVLFLGVFALTFSRLGDVLAFVPAGGSVAAPSPGAAGILLAATFSYLMSWSPYASDYSRYLPTGSSTRRVVIFALVGGALASAAMETIGAMVGSLTPGQGYFAALFHSTGSFGPVAILAVLLGVLAANALNIYTNALSALVLDIKAKRISMVIFGGFVGLVLSFFGQSSFELNYENFLLVLDYWIMPWLGIVLVDYYLMHRTSPDKVAAAASVDSGALGIYAVSVMAAVPFMVPALPLGFPFGTLASLFGGADLSYFVAFAVAALLTFNLRRWQSFRPADAR